MSPEKSSFLRQRLILKAVRWPHHLRSCSLGVTLGGDRGRILGRPGDGFGVADLVGVALLGQEALPARGEVLVVGVS